MRYMTGSEDLYSYVKLSFKFADLDGICDCITKRYLTNLLM